MLVLDATRGTALTLVAAALLAALVSLGPAGPAALGYDPEAWLVWGRELRHGTLDVTAGPAVKPLPVLLDAAAGAVAGDRASRSLWAITALAGLFAALVLAAELLRRAGGRGPWVLAGPLCVLATPSLVEGALTGAAEPLALAAMLAAVVALTRQRPGAAAVALGVAALLRPEALPALLALLAIRIAREPEARRRAGGAAAGAALVATVIGAWAGLQLVGGGSLGAGVGAATALRAGQPGLADAPVIAALGAALLCLWPAIPVALAGLAGSPGAPPAEGATVATRWAAGIGALWILTVAAMAGLGFSGEVRYAAPGAALVTLALAAWAVPRLPAGSPAAAAGALGLAVLLVAAYATIRPAWVEARALAATQRDLTALLHAASPPGRECRTVAAGPFMRPAVAWRLERPMSSVRAPSTQGDCILTKDGGRPAVAARPLAREGPWTWWRANAPVSAPDR